MGAQSVRLLARYGLLAAGIVLLNFFIPRLLPGDPLSFRSGEGTDSATPLSRVARDQLRDYYRLDEPVSEQLIAYLGDLTRGDLGRSIARSAPVRELILDRLPWTLGLLIAALLITVAIGTAAGLAAGWHPGSRRDRAIVSLATALAAVPEFLIAIGLLLIFAVGLGWFPLFGGETVFASYGADLGGTIHHSLDVVWHLTLPAVTLVFAGTASVLLLTRDTAAGLHQAPWLTVARAKGLPEQVIARRHALPNVALPLFAFLGLRLGSVLGGALVVERVFSIPGLGLLGFQAIRARDYPVLQALFLLSGLGVLTANLLVDLISLRWEARRGTFGG